jgi:glycerol-3-phosphate dehydrogenase (NAD(P)+)
MGSVDDRTRYLQHARTKGVNRCVYWFFRGLFQPFFAVWLRMGRIGREHLPKTGPAILACNHRSFLDPFVIAMLTRRPVYSMAKEELFKGRIRSWLLVRVGAFPIRRGAGDLEAMETARAILERGDIVIMFPEGTRVRRGPLGQPHGGAGRLALETGAPLIPVAINGTQNVRRGWRIRPRRITVRAGAPMAFGRADRVSSQLAAAITDRVWANVEVQWEWLGGTPPLRRAVVLGAGAWGTALAAALGRAGVATTLGAQSTEQALELTLDRENARDLPGVELPRNVAVAVATDVRTDDADLIARAGADTLTAEHPGDNDGDATAALGADAGPATALADGGTVTVASGNGDLQAQLALALRAAGVSVRRTRDTAAASLPLPPAPTARPPSQKPDSARPRIHEPVVGD